MITSQDTNVLSDEDLRGFLDTYGQSLQDFNAEASAALWGLPGTILTDDFAGSLNSRADMALGLAQAYPFYRLLGLARVTYDLLERVNVTERITQVRLRWHFAEASGSELTDAEYVYTLRADEDGPHFYVAISINETEHLQRLAAERGLGGAAA
ncbi:hypothetical protein [Lysinibacter cavernae]|uniref:Nuclear transport factor 2 family protein n=1 Tax=Lysinibacter cavernae TaxID=1640652 RepID=A0A7X5R300_9MICO|nr:hypothetical protein [Lysinibacter cavernae]NIH54735.1 hypothetical protein [Lysinibacter cavernae]